VDQKKSPSPAVLAAIKKAEAVSQARFKERLSAEGEKAPTGKGFLTIVATREKTGEILQIEHGENIVVKLGRSALAHLSAGDSVDQHKIVAMMFGDATGTPGVGDTGLFGSIITINGNNNVPVTVSFPDSGGDDMKVSFTATIGANEGNGGGTQVYREACLVKGNGDIFSHKVSGDITKDNTVVLTATWTYIYTILLTILAKSLMLGTCAEFFRSLIV